MSQNDDDNVIQNNDNNAMQNDNDNAMQNDDDNDNNTAQYDNARQYDNAKLNYIRDTIENMSIQNHIEILKIITKFENIVINSNKSGIRINLAELNPEVIDELFSYIKYIQKQEQNLDVIEKQKDDYKNEFFSQKTR